MASGEPDPRRRESRLVLHVGERRVAVLDERAASRYIAIMEAAAASDELPWHQSGARLTRRPDPDGYLLELKAPP